MLFYLLSAEELRGLLDRLGYRLEPDAIPRNVNYYLERTSHGSTLSGVVNAWVLARSDRTRSWRFFTEALASDLHDLQGGTTAEGIHLGAMAGTVDLAQRCYTGLEAREDVLWLNPSLPEELDGLDFDVRYRGNWGINLHLTPTAAAGPRARFLRRPGPDRCQRPGRRARTGQHPRVPALTSRTRLIRMIPAIAAEAGGGRAGGVLLAVDPSSRPKGRPRHHRAGPRRRTNRARTPCLRGSPPASANGRRGQPTGGPRRSSAAASPSSSGPA